MNILETIGNTPLVRLKNITDKEIYVKIEKNNPAGSIKDRPAYYMILDAIKTGKLKPGMKIVEPTSGNTGIALAMIGKILGYEVTIIMSESMSLERRALIKSYGAKLILSDPSKGTIGSVNMAKEMCKSGKYYMPNQFSNPINSYSHEITTGRELIESGIDIKGFVAGIGTGGTVTGVGRALKKKDSKIAVWGIEPKESPLITTGLSGKHKIQGMGTNFVPKVLDKSILDNILTISGDDAIKMAKRLALEEGLMVGISSGANVLGALEMSKQIDGAIVTVLPDSSERYMSTALFDEKI